MIAPTDAETALLMRAYDFALTIVAFPVLMGALCGIIVVNTMELIAPHAPRD